MTYHKILDNGYIVAVGKTDSPLSYQHEITQEEYEQVMSLLQSRPTVPDGYRLRLNDSTKEWDAVLIPAEPVEEEDVSDSEIIEALEGVI